MKHTCIKNFKNVLNMLRIASRTFIINTGLKINFSAWLPLGPVSLNS